MLTVLQVTPALDAGGVERTTIEVAEALVQAGGRALVASRGGRLAHDLADVGGTLIRLPLDTKSPFKVWSNASALEEVARTNAVSIIHARSRAPAWSAYWAARRLKTPFVTTYHGIYNARSPLKRWYNSIMAKGRVVIANSNYTRDHILKEHGIDPARIVVIPRGVDLARFDPLAVDPAEAAGLRKGWLGGRDGHVVLLPARMTAWKGHRIAIEAAAKLEARRPGLATFVFAGDAQGRDDYVTDLRRRIGELKLIRNVLIVGHLSDVATALAASDLAIFPSIEPEAFGRAAVEAQAMGVPVIAAAHGGLTETVVDGETGLHVKPGDVSALADAVERLLLVPPDARLTMGRAGQERARRLYSKTALQRATLEVYERVMREGP